MATLEKNRWRCPWSPNDSAKAVLAMSHRRRIERTTMRLGDRPEGKHHPTTTVRTHTHTRRAVPPILAQIGPDGSPISPPIAAAEIRAAPVRRSQPPLRCAAQAAAPARHHHHQPKQPHSQHILLSGSDPGLFPIPATACTAVRESRPPKLRPLRSCTGRRAIRFLGSVSARLLATVRALLRRIGCFIDRSDYTMGDINNTHGGGAAAGATFPVAMYVLFLSYLALLLVPCSDLMHVLSLMCVVKYACASIMLLSNKTLLWLTAMGVHRVAEGIPRGPLTPEEDKAFGDATVIFVGAVLSVLGDKLVDAYLHIRNGKELWDALDAKFGAADAGGELYAMEQFNDYRMVENRSVVEQAHEIQIMAKELELLKCVLPDKFVAGCIVAKLPPSWRNFATSLKHQRHEFSVENIMGSLDVEEKARAKDKHTGGTEGRSAANMVQKNAHKSKGKNKGVSQTTNFKKKGKTEKKDPCWVCGETGHWANRCPQRKGKKCQAGQNSTSVNMVIGNTEEGTTGHEVPQ
ncbi:hypothetical protein QYE76_022185 [Lolium multiflorum]|uniref:CCHC-type domain-containing protein n=1 Tax=Lolium multiflorum TaxID=4521 RepID=A0AAD8VTW9_LOLMU|nr:hypothetical protein QYE76_022185 [Lolium multiflorum]